MLIIASICRQKYTREVIDVYDITIVESNFWSSKAESDQKNSKAGKQ